MKPWMPFVFSVVILITLFLALSAGSRILFAGITVALLIAAIAYRVLVWPRRQIDSRLEFATDKEHFQFVRKQTKLMAYGSYAIAASLVWLFASLQVAKNTWDQAIWIILAPAGLMLGAGLFLLGIGFYKLQISQKQMSS